MRKVGGKIRAAGGFIDEYFRSLTGHPAIPRLDVTADADPRGTNSYAFKDERRQDVIPILNQGDMNCLALSIFLALSNAATETTPFGFVMFDDPSQSLGAHHKRQLAELVNQVAQDKQVIVATMDSEFRDLLSRTVTRAKKVYSFGEWSPNDGPALLSE